jgi:hypothetical protein
MRFPVFFVDLIRICYVMVMASIFNITNINVWDDEWNRFKPEIIAAIWDTIVVCITIVGLTNFVSLKDFLTGNF